ncbi:MAG: hypothetical protein M1830_006358, partial [Pleopsidium flavum]
ILAEAISTTTANVCKMMIRAFLALLFVSGPILHNNLVVADTLSRSWCQCSGRDLYGTADEYNYHSDRLKKTYTYTDVCSFPPEFESTRQRCNGARFKYPKSCKTFDDKHELCYDRNFWGKDTVALDGKKTELKHKNMKSVDVLDCTERCRKRWPHAVGMSSACNYTVPGVAVTALAKDGCSTDFFTKLKVL